MWWIFKRKAFIIKWSHVININFSLRYLNNVNVTPSGRQLFQLKFMHTQMFWLCNRHILCHVPPSRKDTIFVRNKDRIDIAVGLEMLQSRTYHISTWTTSWYWKRFLYVIRCVHVGLVLSNSSIFNQRNGIYMSSGGRYNRSIVSKNVFRNVGGEG